MKKSKKLGLLILFTVLTALLALVGCQAQPQGLEGNLESPQSAKDEVVFYKMNSFSEVDEESKVTYTDSTTYQVFQMAVKKAKKLPGVVDVASPQYGFELDHKSYFLWLDEGRKTGSLMHAEDTHYLYHLSEDSLQPLYDLVREYLKQVGE